MNCIQQENLIAKQWHDIELKKESLNILLNQQNSSKIKELFLKAFSFQPNLSYEENMKYIKQSLEEKISHELSDKVVDEFEKNIAKLNDIKYGSSSFHDAHLYEREFACREPWSYHFGKLLSKKGLKENSAVLDVGINDGEEIGVFPFKITGVDLSEKAIAKAKQKFPELQLITGNANSLPFKNSLFDAYISLKTLCVTGIYETKAISEAYRVLKRNGLLIVSFPNTMYDKGSILKVSKYNLLECDPAALVEKGKHFYTLLNGLFHGITCYKNGVEDFICGIK